MKITEVEARRGLLRRYGRCFVCLRKGHMGRNCESSYECNKCSGRHHISLCENPAKHSIVNNYCTNKNNILLQTATAQASAVNSKLHHSVRLLFDTGSQRSYISNKVRSRLNLPVIRREKILIQTFGHSNSKVKVVDIVQVRIKHRRDNHYVFVEAVCVPEICVPLKKSKH